MLTILFYVIIVHIGLELLGIIIHTRKDYSKKIFTSSGCNVFNSPIRENYCIEHDKAYARGGWVLARWKADWNLFKCLWNHNKLIALVIFIGVRAFGSFEFEYGRKRKLNYPDGSTD